ncbi:MAG: dihydroorotase [Pelagibacteraceae bacterium]|nr:dihydroorotase [Pelagibacteraceae bacterium]MDP6710096.1 dihydroorotase [Pelagibacteraceae bacterium]
MKEKYLINARIIDPKNQMNEVGGLIIDSKGLIKAVGKKVANGNLPSSVDKIDLKKQILIPGIVDMRVFVGEPGYEYKENFRTLSNAALSGGVTSVVSMPNTSPVIDNVSMVDFLKRRGRDKSRINIFPSASLTKNTEGKQMTEFGLLKRKGIVAFTDGIKTIQNPQVMARIMNFASQSESLIMQHAEDNILSAGGLINEGEISTRLGLKGIPFLAEKIIVERDLSFLEEFFCRYHVSQISSEKTVSVVKKAKNDGKIFSTGVSINNLSLNENDIGDFRTFLKLSPPLRTEKDRKSLVQGINEGIIDVIVSDHKPEDEESKRLTFSQAMTGATGIETLLPLALELFHNKSIKLEKLIAAITSNPAKILNINKGNLEKGNDADLCVFDINKSWIVDKDKLKSKSKNTPIENRKLHGQVLKTFVKGEVAFERI